MSNPYKAPEARVSDQQDRRAVSQPKVRNSSWQTALSLVIAAFCVLQFWGVLTVMLRGLADLGVADAPILKLLWMLLLPFTLFLGGVLLAFARRIAALCFAAYLSLYLVEMSVRDDGFGNILTLAAVTGFLAYSLWQWKRGILRGWPNNSSKPTPLRGAA